MSIQQKFFWFLIMITTFSAGFFHIVDTYFMEIQSNLNIERLLMIVVSGALVFSLYMIIRENKNKKG